MMLLTFILICFACYLNLASGACPYGISVRGVNSTEIVKIVALHNNIRLKIAKGQLSGQPKGINLKRMRWDANLAKEAQKVANTCNLQHLIAPDSRWPSVGQNLFWWWQSTAYAAADWNAAVNWWINEYKQYRYPNGFSPVTGHYTQVVWAATTHVGCGYSYYRVSGGGYQKFYVCNYGPGGNYNGAPYKTGTSGCENLC